VAAGPAHGLLRRIVLAGSGTLAQFGGVMLAFAFLATFGFNGLVTLFLHDWLGLDIFAWGAWIYELPGLALVYTYFQIPLMVIVFLPAVEGLKPQWREACLSLGGDSWAYWRHVGLPILWPSFLGATLLLFANAFSAYATAKALISQASPLVPLRIGTFLTSEIVLGRANLGNALAFGMILIVAVTMTLYALLQRRTSAWLR
jgi:putative spermidine/putrescine transport system permease protein